MKKFITVFFITFLAFSCAKDGEIGPKGKKGVDGAIGPKGSVGDKGATGSSGPQGNAGFTQTAVIYFSDWTPHGKYVKESDNGRFVTYYFSKDFLVDFFSFSRSVLLTLTDNLKEFYVLDAFSKSLMGTLYVYNSILDVNGNRIVFQGNFSDNRISFSNFNFGFAFGNGEYPYISGTYFMNFLKSNYPANTNFELLMETLKPQTRLIFIPGGLPVNSGRLQTVVNYEDLIKKYGIPSSGSSK